MGLLFFLCTGSIRVFGQQVSTIYLLTCTFSSTKHTCKKKGSDAKYGRLEYTPEKLIIQQYQSNDHDNNLTGIHTNGEMNLPSPSQH